MEKETNQETQVKSEKPKKSKKKIALVAVIVVVLGIFCVKSFDRVGQGEVGVVYTMSSGVQDKTLSPGYHFIAPWAKVKHYPVAQQQLVLSNNPEDYNESEHADWHVDAPADGGMDGDQIVDTMVQNSIIAYIKEVTPQFSVMDIYSDKRSEVSKTITEYLNTKLTEEYGINISSALIIDVQLDEALQEKVKAKEQAKQDAEKAELDKQTAIAQGEADKARAEAEAAVTITNAQAEAEANKIISDSITDNLIRMTEAEARKKHGWVTVKGADTVVADASKGN